MTRFLTLLAVMTALAATLASGLVSGLATAQETEGNDKGFLVRFLEDTLSNDTRGIAVTGLEGAFSSRATIQQIEVSDPDGVWLRVTGAVLDWNPAALLRKRFSVNELTAERIEVLRRPLPQPNTDLPTPESKPFALPDLPVAVQISKVSLGKLVLAEPVAGLAAELSMTGQFTLADGALDTDLRIDRLDRAGDRIALAASYANENREIGLDLRVEEAAGGLISALMKLPGAPPVILTAKGDGPVEDFAADLKLATDGVDRLRGRVDLAGDGGVLGIKAVLDGDLRPLLAETYRPFFGPVSRFRLEGQRRADGALDVSHLTLAADAIRLSGALGMTADGTADKVALDIALVPVDGAEVVLPLPGGATRLSGLTAQAGFDAQAGDGWTLTADLKGLSRPDLAVGSGTLVASGRYRPRSRQPLDGTIEATLEGLVFNDPDLSTAVGDALGLRGGFALDNRQRLTLSGFDIDAAGLKARADVMISGLATGFALDGRAEVSAADLSRYDGLGGLPLTGALSATLEGSAAPLSGSFDIVLAGTARDLTIGQAQVDPLLTGETRVRLDARRDETGLLIRELALDGTALDLKADGKASTGRASLTLSAGLDDLGRILPDVPGPVRLTGTATQSADAWSTALSFTAPGGAAGEMTANLPTDENAPLSLDLSVSEPAGGPIGKLARIPGGPALRLEVAGTGQGQAFSGDLALSTDGVRRIEGHAETRAIADESMAWNAQVSGDLRPLIAPELAGFFGAQSEATAMGQRHGDGSLVISDLSLRAASLDLSGKAALDASGLPQTAELRGLLRPSGTDRTVRLPVPGADITLTRSSFALTLDGEADQTWTLQAEAEDITHPQARLGRLTLSGAGAYEATSPLRLDGALRAGLSGLSLRDAALNRAVGAALTLSSSFAFPGDDTLKLSDMTLVGRDLKATGAVSLSGLAETQDFDGTLGLALSNLGNFSGLAGRPLGGALDLDASGTGALGSRQIDGTLSAVLRDATTGIKPADALLAGTTRLRVEAATRPGGFDLRSLRLDGPGIEGRASGSLAGAATDLSATLTLPDLGLVLPKSPGPATLHAGLTQDQGKWVFASRLDAPNESYAQANGHLDAGGAADLSFQGQMNRLERFMPDFAGSLLAKGRASREDGRWTFTADANGPADIDVALAGSFDESAGTADATAQGNLQLAAANAFIAPMSINGSGAFDLALKGKPALAALSGQITLSGANIAVPQAQMTIQGFGGQVGLEAGSARLDLSGGLSADGRFSVQGPVALAAPFEGDLAIALSSLVLTDNVVYRAPVSGDLRFSGPLAGNANLSGRIDIGETEIDISAAGGSSSAAPIPPLIHVAEPGAVRATRARAGLVQTGSGRGGGPDIGLDLLISAPRKIFVRGRGLDAELGGEILVRGTTSSIAPSGQIGLIRGIMALFGRRIELSKGLISLQGSLKPFLDFAATSSTNAGSATLEISGDLDDLGVTITSDPELPDEEALALLIFGDEYANLSPFKIAQIAAGLVTLRGGGGDVVGKNGRKVTGADNVNLAGDKNGNPSLGVGGYISDNIYTDVAVSTEGDTELNINLDLTDSLTVKGTVDNSGGSGLGLFFKRDY